MIHTARYALLALVLLSVAAWLSAASWLFVQLGGLGAHYPDAWNGMAWLRTVAAWHANTGWTDALLIVSTVPLTAVYGLVGFAVSRPLMRRGRLRWRAAWGMRRTDDGWSDNHGRARWASLAEARRRFRGGHPDYGGVVVGEALLVHESGVADVPFEEGDRGTWGRGKAPLLIDSLSGGSGPYALVIAGSGGYKTQSAAIPALFTWTGSLVCVDPKGKLHAQTRRVREGMGHKVVVLRPGMAGPNALDWIDPRDPLAEMHIRGLVADVCQPAEEKGAQKNETNALFSDTARTLVTCLLADMLWDRRDRDRSLRALREIICRPSNALKAGLKRIAEKSESTLARDLAGSIIMSDRADETWEGVRIHANHLTEWLSIEAFARMVSGGGFRTDDIATDKMTVYIEMPLAALRSTPQAARALITGLMGAMYRHGSLKNRALFVLDEAKQLRDMAALEIARDVGRESGIAMLLLYQSLGQIRGAWGKDGAASWFASAAWTSFSCVADIETAELVSKLCGKRGVLAYSSGENAGSSSRGVAGSGGNSSGNTTNVHEIGRDLIQPAELIHKMRRDEQIVITAGSDPMRLSRAIAFRRSDMHTEEEPKDGVDGLHAEFSASQPGRGVARATSAAGTGGIGVSASRRAAISGHGANLVS